MRYTIYSRGDEVSEEIASRIQDELSKRKEFQKDTQDPQLIICVGGDGTILRAIHRYIHIIDSVGFVAIHTGTLGFFTDYTKDEIDGFLQDITSEPAGIQKFPLLECVCQLENEEMSMLALNEFRVGTFASSVKFEIYIDGEYFETTNGCGISVATQAGSTGANRSLGGAVVDDGLSMLQLCEIMPVSHKSHHTLLNPYIMNADRSITIIPKSRVAEFEISYDHLCRRVENVRRMEISYSHLQVSFYRYRPYSYLKRLRNLY